jgi:hypothetical protein
MNPASEAGWAERAYVGVATGEVDLIEGIEMGE